MGVPSGVLHDYLIDPFNFGYPQYFRIPPQPALNSSCSINTKTKSGAMSQCSDSSSETLFVRFRRPRKH